MKRTLNEKKIYSKYRINYKIDKFNKTMSNVLNIEFKQLK